ncbi:hypothetical protein H4R20_001856 [Coemansia guatemalensis]|uniref:Uncharacterized protein n=1 Tax=Coemansia guatemalensis TaxID=2761395 RepID=A0A9W8HYS4_9FUNG|nr:hypothetical protein H4R20_001856 [Coemansia guatemalensis]
MAAACVAGALAQDNSRRSKDIPPGGVSEPDPSDTIPPGATVADPLCPTFDPKNPLCFGLGP